jgi:hypothetical protein
MQLDNIKNIFENSGAVFGFSIFKISNVLHLNDIDLPSNSIKQLFYRLTHAKQHKRSNNKGDGSKCIRFGRYKLLHHLCKRSL